MAQGESAFIMMLFDNTISLMATKSQLRNTQVKMAINIAKIDEQLDDLSGFFNQLINYTNNNATKNISILS